VRSAEPIRSLADSPDVGFDAAAALRRDGDLLSELRAVKGLIEERFGALAFMEKLQRRPAEARLAQKLLDCGFSPMLVRKMADGFNAADGDETEWAAQILEKNLRTAAAHESIEDRGGVFALIGATGVGKTTTTAKIAAAFAARHGAANLGLITLDAYRVGAHEQLRAYGRILGVPVHTAHDRASLEDLLDLLTAKKMVLIDTAGMAQRDTRNQGAARHDLAPQRAASARRQRGVAGRDDRGRAGRVPREQLRRRRPEQARRGDQARPGARRRDPPQAHRRRRRQRPARPRGLASPVGERAGAAGDARRRQRRLAPRRRPR
jgi:flagellar biosynthetic protein FlhF